MIWPGGLDSPGFRRFLVARKLGGGVRTFYDLYELSCLEFERFFQFCEIADMFDFLNNISKRNDRLRFLHKIEERICRMNEDADERKKRMDFERDLNLFKLGLKKRYG